MLLLFLITVVLASSVSTRPDDVPRVALEGCEDRCGDLIIPYPFGIRDNCSHNSSFTIVCSTFSNPPSAFLPSHINWSRLSVQYGYFPPPSPGYRLYGAQVVQISLGTDTSGYGANNSISITGSWDQFNISGKDRYGFKVLDLKRSPYMLMGERNALLVGGCNGGAVLIRNRQKETVDGCATVCVNASAQTDGMVNSCYGLGCCQSALPTSLDFVEMDFLNLLRRQSISAATVSAALVDLSYVADRTVDRYLSAFKEAPTVLQWRITDLDVNSSVYSKSSCVKVDGSYICRCKRYYHGNPYLPNGCRAVKECGQCPSECTLNQNGKFGCPIPPLLPPPIQNTVTGKLAIGLGTSLASIFLLIILSGLYQLLKQRKEMRKKKENFKRNGGLLLQQQMSASDSSIERTKVFSSSELVKATDNFDENRVLGRGGQGTVYKGMLVDGTIVAVKKSKKISERQLGQFINEVVILSQINHRNVVKLYGCCLETDVPLLVYEYAPNGTLYQHIHHPSEDFRITWKMRLQIATESAEALAYIHSSSVSPIYHRDIKTFNILLDGRYRAKVSDFGTSKTLSIDQTHVTTCVLGTFGYMDPEFLQSNRFTEKSDVYSFGIVLLELLTSKKAVYSDRSEDPKNLAAEFLIVMQSSHLYDIMDTKVLEEAQKEDVESVAHLAKRCLNLNGKYRPTMKDVAMALQMINSQNHASGTSQQDSVTREDLIVEQICSRDGGSLSTSSSYAPR